MQAFEIHNLIFRYLTDEASEDEMFLLDEWLDISLENRQYFKKCRKLCNEFEQTNPAPEINIDDINNESEPDLAADDPPNNFAHAGSLANYLDNLPAFWGKYWRHALSSTAVIILLGLFFWLVLQGGNNFTFISTGNYERQDYHLPDHSRVLLDAQAEIAFPSSFSSYLRVVYLQGHAFFNITRSSKPFIVLTKYAAIRAYQTSFDVDSRSNKTKVTVSSGKVTLELRGSNEKQRVVVQAGEMSVCRKAMTPTRPRAIQAGKYFQWLEKTIAFEERSMAGVVAELQQRYKVKIRLADQDVANLTLSGDYQHTDFEPLLTTICQTLNLEYHLAGNIYFINQKQK